MYPNLPTKENIKQVLISILIGAIVSFLTVLFQGLVEWLKHIPAEIPAVAAAWGKYLYSVKS